MTKIALAIDRQSRCVVRLLLRFSRGLKFKPTAAKRNFEDVTKMMHGEFTSCLYRQRVNLSTFSDRFSLSRQLHNNVSAK